MKVQEEDKIAGPARMNERIRRDRELSRKTFQEQTHDLILRAHSLPKITNGQLHTRRWERNPPSTNCFNLQIPPEHPKSTNTVTFSTDIWQEMNRAPEDDH